MPLPVEIVLKGEYHNATEPLYARYAPLENFKMSLVSAFAETASQELIHPSRPHSNVSTVSRGSTKINLAKRSATIAFRDSFLMRKLPSPVKIALQELIPLPWAQPFVWNAIPGNISTYLRERGARFALWDLHKTCEGQLLAHHVIEGRTAIRKGW